MSVQGLDRESQNKDIAGSLMSKKYEVYDSMLVGVWMTTSQVAALNGWFYPGAPFDGYIEKVYPYLESLVKEGMLEKRKGVPAHYYKPRGSL